MDVIHLWWIGEKEPKVETLERVRARVARAFGRPAAVRQDPARPSAYDARRGQHSSTQILEWLRRPHAGLDPADKVLAMTDQDLFIPILTFVFGEAQLKGPAAVVSTARLADETGAIGSRLVLERLSKESVHELGHAFGLIHCASPRCVMARSSSLREVDAKSGELCRDCRTQLGELRRKGE